MEAPDIGTLVEYGLDSFGQKPQRWRVKSWIREAPTPKFDENDFNDVINKILFEGCQKIRGKRWQFCLQKEATHVGLSGIAGTIAPINELVIVGFVNWGKRASGVGKKSRYFVGHQTRDDFLIQ